MLLGELVAGNHSSNNCLSSEKTRFIEDNMARRNVYRVNLFDSNFFHTHYSQCTFPECNYQFQEADWTYFGKDTKGNWHHVCENHRDSIEWNCLQVCGHIEKENYRIEPYIIPSYASPPQPDTDLWLWRYMNYERFKSFLETKSIFFPKVTTFSDPLECSVSIKEQMNWLNSIRATAYQFSDNDLDSFPEEEKMAIIANRIQEEISNNKEFRNNVLISCWHANDYESEAMWQLYKGKYHHTVAISINMCNLRNALPKPIHVGAVSYVDFEQVYPTKIRAFKKHISYEHEKEIRAVIFPEHINIKAIKDITIDKNDSGLFIKPDEKFLQIKIFLSPWCSNRFRKKVKDLINESDWNRSNETNPSIVEIIETKYEPLY